MRSPKPTMNSFCCCLSLRAGCLAIGWYDIVYSIAMVLFYLSSMYTGYFSGSATYLCALWIDFVFLFVQLLGGVLLVYGVKHKNFDLVELSSGIGVVMILEDVIGDSLLYLSFPDLTLTIRVTAGTALLTFIAMRGYWTFTVYVYYKILQAEVVWKNKYRHTLSSIVHTYHS